MTEMLLDKKSITIVILGQCNDDSKAELNQSPHFRYVLARGRIIPGKMNEKTMNSMQIVLSNHVCHISASNAQNTPNKLHYIFD